MTRSSLEIVAIDAPRTVGDARRWLRHQVGRWAPAGAGDAAELVLSELVTNAVLHSEGPLRVSLSHRSGCLVIEVVDGNGHGVPTIRYYSTDAATGRGMHVVARLSSAWGVRHLAAGKGVWALLADPADPERSARCARCFAPATWLLADPTAATPRVGHTGLPGHRSRPARVVAPNLPVWVYVAGQEHNDALMRELRFVAQGPTVRRVPRHLFALVSDRERPFNAELALLRAQVDEARARGAATVDLELPVSQRSLERFTRLAALHDEADGLCTRGELLTLVSPPVVRRFRAWFLEQLRARLDGREPTPWAGPFERPGHGDPGRDDSEGGA